MSDDLLIKVEHVSKKFCRNLKRALWYGARDIGTELLGRNGHADQLRPGEFWAVDDVSFEVRRGECLGLIGPNGAGKSTLLKMLNGLIKPDRGRITVRGHVGSLVQLGAGFNPILTGRENIYINGAVLGMDRREIDRKLDMIVDFAGIEPFLDTPVQFYSSGMSVRLGFSVAAHLDPDMLLVDEVLAVGDMEFVGRCFNRIGSLKDQGTSIVFVSHSMQTIQRLCSRAIVLTKENGCWNLPAAEAVASYNQLMHSVSVTPPSVCNIGSDITITALEVLDRHGQTICRPVATYEPICLRVSYRCTREVSLPGMLFELRFYGGPTASLVATVNSQHVGLEVPKAFQDGVVEVYTALPLAPGPYRIDCGFRPSNRIGLLGWAPDAGTIAVTGTGYVEGVVSLSYRITHQPRPSVDQDRGTDVGAYVDETSPNAPRRA